MGMCRQILINSEENGVCTRPLLCLTIQLIEWHTPVSIDLPTTGSDNGLPKFDTDTFIRTNAGLLKILEILEQI